MLGVALAIGCGDASMPDDGQRTQPPDVGTPPTTAPAAVAPLIDDATAIAWLDRECRGCHAKKSGVLDASWPMPDVLTKQYLETTDATASAYRQLGKKLAGVEDGTYPSPMPLGAMSDDRKRELADVVRWFEARLPHSTGNREASVEPACGSFLTVREFGSRLTNAALGRDATVAELAPFAADEPVTVHDRTALVTRLEAEWKSEFVASGLRRFTTALSTAGALRYPGDYPVDGTKQPLPGAVLQDLSQELHQLVVAKYDAWDYRDYFTSNVVMASPATAPYYGCNVASGWSACTLAPPRKGFFTTLGYLNLLEQTFFFATDNSRRFVGMLMTINGEGPPRTGEAGPAATPPPDCIDSTDTRSLFNPGLNMQQPVGAQSVLQNGKVCESCHLRIGVTAGMIVFRTFSTTGGVYASSTFGTPNMADAAEFASVMDPKWQYVGSDGASHPLDVAFMKRLVDAPTRACIGSGDRFTNVTSVDELARHFLADADAVSRGFARHAQRTFASDRPITLETMVRIQQSFDAGATRIPDLLKAYFLADSFACAPRE
jgi:hypothetical protein